MEKEVLSDLLIFYSSKEKKKLELYTNILYNQELLIEGLPISDPVEFTNNICRIMKQQISHEAVIKILKMNRCNGYG